MNPQPSVLETDALPVELVPSDGPRPCRRPLSTTGLRVPETGAVRVCSVDLGIEEWVGPDDAREIAKALIEAADAL